MHWFFKPLPEALLAFFATTLGCVVLWQLRDSLGQFMHVGIAALFLLVPRWLLDRRQADWAAYGLTMRPVGRGLAFAFGAGLLVFPLFAVGFVFYYDWICAAGWLPGLCRAWKGWAGASLTFAPSFAGQALAQVVAVALPEEFFYRGYLQGRLEEVWPSRFRLWGANVGLAWILQSALFGIAHVLVDGDVRRLATFFPALLFGWMRQATGSVLAPTLFHAMCNLFSDTLHQSFFR